MMKLKVFLRPYRTFVFMVLVLTFVQSLATLYLPNLMSDIVDKGIIKGDVSYIIRIGFFMLGITILGGIASVWASYFAAKSSAGFGQVLRSRLFSHVEKFTLAEFDQLGTSSLIVRTTNDVMQVQQLVNMMLRMMVMAPLTAIGGIIMAVYTDAKLSLIIVVVIPVLSLAIYGILGPGMGLFRTMQKKVDHLNRVLRENLTGTRVIRSFNREVFEIQRFDQANRDLTDVSIRVYKMMAAMMPVVMLIMNISTLAIVWFGGIRINDGTLQVGNLMAFIQYVMQIMFAVMMVSMMAFMIPRGQASALRINEVLAMHPEIVDPVQSQASVDHSGQVEFRDVTFRYPGAEEPALSHVSFIAQPGQITAIIGGTGSGKSTLINLIPRFHDVDSGSVIVDGMDVREMPQESLRAKLGYVPQRAVLFTGKILDNIKYGKEEATEAEILHAAEVAQAAEFIAAMPDGFHSVISQGGANISGGQKQRLAIARALVRKPEIYLFDDTFSALDYKTDAQLGLALRQEAEAATVILVAQRVSTVIEADQIIVLDEGRVVGVGTHKSLLQTCAVYQEIVSSQLSPEEIA
ncbi:MAG: ABC transporter ATP-binding protein [Sulfobacillus sp.]